MAGTTNDKTVENERLMRMMEAMGRGIPMPDKIGVPPPPGPFPRKSDPAALARVEAEIAALKAATFTSWVRDRSFNAGVAFGPAREGTWNDLTEKGKLAALGWWVDWNGVSPRDRRIAFTKHLDGSQLPQELADRYLDMVKDRAPDQKPGTAGKQRGGKKSLADLKAQGKAKQPGRQKARSKGMER